MVARQQVVNKLRAIGFTYSRQGERVDLYRRKGSGNCELAAVPRRDLLSEAYVINLLTRHGVSIEEAMAFCGTAKT